MNKKNVLVFLAKGKDAVLKFGEFLAVKMLGGSNKLVIDLEGIKSLNLESRLKLASMMNIDQLYRAKKYDALICLGEFEGFINRGLEHELIARYPKLKKYLSKNIDLKAVSLVTEKMLEDYIKNPTSKEFGFFIVHPLGLKVLVDNQFSGFIAAHEKEFRKVAEHYPEKFDSYMGKYEYNKLLDKILD